MTKHVRIESAESADAFSLLPATQLADVPTDALLALRRLRAEAEAEIERLLAFLDMTEPDCDLEPDLGHTPLHGQLLDAEDEHDGREPEHDDEDDGSLEVEPDDEPSLGWPESIVQGQHIGEGHDMELRDYGLTAWDLAIRSRAPRRSLLPGELA